MIFKTIKLNILVLTISMLISCTNNQVINKSQDYKYYDIFNLSPVEVIIPKNQTNSQSLSIIVTDNSGNLVVFDGGRVEDSDYLCDIIKEKGGVVTTWFLTHIHDDHIGALYNILNNKRTDIEIKTIAYEFADFDWYYSKMGDDAGILILFENAINEYNAFLASSGKNIVNIINKFDYFDPTGNFKYFKNKNGNKINDFYVSILNYDSVYKLEQDPINNTSIVYSICLNPYETNKTNMLVFGDLGYEGGNSFFDKNDSLKDTMGKDLYNAKILVLAHHGQNGIDVKYYERFSPEVVIWPTSKDIYENKNDKYYTNDTKSVIDNIKSIKYQIKTYEETAVIR